MSEMIRNELDILEKALDLLERNELDEAHKLAQYLEGMPAGDTIHAIVHRKDGDYLNSIYWWRRVGSDLPPELQRIYGDPVFFVNRCRNAIIGTPEHKAILEIETKEIAIIRSFLPSKNKRKPTEEESGKCPK
jgi:hypothetical protein